MPFTPHFPRFAFPVVRSPFSLSPPPPPPLPRCLVVKPGAFFPRSPMLARFLAIGSIGRLCSEDSFVNDGPLSYVTSSSQEEADEDDEEGTTPSHIEETSPGRGHSAERRRKTKTNKRRRKGPKFETEDDEKVGGGGGEGGCREASLRVRRACARARVGCEFFRRRVLSVRTQVDKAPLPCCSQLVRNKRRRACNVA